MLAADMNAMFGLLARKPKLNDFRFCRQTLALGNLAPNHYHLFEYGKNIRLAHDQQFAAINLNFRAGIA